MQSVELNTFQEKKICYPLKEFNSSKIEFDSSEYKLTIHKYFNPWIFKRKNFAIFMASFPYTIELKLAEYVLIYLYDSNLIRKYTDEYLYCLDNYLIKNKIFFYHIFIFNTNFADFTEEQTKKIVGITERIIKEDCFYTFYYPSENVLFRKYTVTSILIWLCSENQYKLSKYILNHPLFHDNNIFNSFLKHSNILCDMDSFADFVVYLTPYINFLKKENIESFSELYCKNIYMFNRNLLKYFHPILKVDNDFNWNVDVSVRIVAEKCFPDLHENLKLKNYIISYDICYAIEKSKNFKDIAHIVRIAENNNCVEDLEEILKIPSIIENITNLIDDNVKLDFFLSEVSRVKNVELLLESLDKVKESQMLKSQITYVSS